jgi:hypothetical protein
MWWPVPTACVNTSPAGKPLWKCLIPGRWYRDLIRWRLRFGDLALTWRYWLIFFVYRGARFEWPFCGGRFRELLAGGSDLPIFREKAVVGGDYRPNAMCPRCLSSDRERLVYLYLSRKPNVFGSGRRLLHVAPEPRLGRALRARSTDYVSVDLDSPLATHAMDVTKLNFLVICLKLSSATTSWNTFPTIARGCRNSIGS